MRASRGHASEKARLANLLQNRASHGRGERSTIERAALVPVRETASVLVRDKRAEGNAAAKPFSQNHHVRLNAGVLKAEESSSSADPRLNFIEDQKDAMPLGQRAQIAEESVRRDEHPGLPLDRLEHDSNCVCRDRSLDLPDIVDHYFAEPPAIRVQA